MDEIGQLLVSLQKTTEQYPECKNAIYQFLHYYIPETVRLVRAYQKYQNAGLTGKTADKVYEKVRDGGSGVGRGCLSENNGNLSDCGVRYRCGSRSTERNPGAG